MAKVPRGSRLLCVQAFGRRYVLVRIRDRSIAALLEGATREAKRKAAAAERAGSENVTYSSSRPWLY